MPKNWTVYTYFQELTALEKMVEEETDPIRKDYLKGVMDDSSRFYFDVFCDDYQYRVPERKALSDLSSSFLAGDRYYSVVEDYFYSLAGFMPKALKLDEELNKRMRDNFNIGALANTYTTHEQAISSLFKLYESMGLEINELFKKAFNNSYLNFNSKHDVILPKGSDGRTYYIDGVDKNFVAVIDSRDSRLVGNLVHEYGHAIRNIVCPESSFTCECDFFGEVPSMFPELVSFEENPGQYPQVIGDYQRYDTFREYYDYAFLLATHPIIYYKWKEHDFKINHHLKQALRKDAIDRKTYKKALSTDIAEEGSYVVSYITALELLHIYREDKKEALKLYKRILQLKPGITYLSEVNRIVPLNVYAAHETERVVDDLTLSLKRGSR